ncbi:STM4013/SEN3800 family hydrolase [Streptomyces sp. NPDC004647]|uniref:STM4013/SEN3800 family hydrolase n=1 Tax=Streptomyces sp. NPDC004647 TaxID=3154671 RepID=UPI0033BB223A
MLNPIDTEAVIRDGRIAGRFPGEIHEGVAWWVGSCFVVVSEAHRIAVAYDHRPTSTEFHSRFCNGAINAQHYACHVTTLGRPCGEKELLSAMEELGDVPGALITSSSGDGADAVTITLFDRDGRAVDEGNGLADIRRMITDDRVPLPVNDAARGRVTPYEAEGRPVIDTAEIIRSGTNILFVTLDSLRYDVAKETLQAGQTPRLGGLLPEGRWERRQTPGTFTLPAHMAFFSGFLPKLPQPIQPPRLWECRPPAFKRVRPETFVFDAPSLLAGLRQHGYRTVCVGGVTYFSRETPLGSVLPDMFDEDHWRPEFCSPEIDSTRNQVDQALETAEIFERRQPLFLFVNVSATHVPHGHYLESSTDNTASQAAALAYADADLGRLIDGLTARQRWLIIMCADHGDAYGDDGYYGRGIAHPAVMNVPFAATVRG